MRVRAHHFPVAEPVTYQRLHERLSVLVRKVSFFARPETSRQEKVLIDLSIRKDNLWRAQ
jgi:hypothetical protein